MRSETNTLAVAIARLEQALTEDTAYPRSWGARLERSLAAVEQAIAREDTLVGVPDGKMIDVGSGRTPSPWVERCVEQFHDDLAHFHAEAEGLRAALHSAAGVPENLRTRTRALLEALKRYQQEEDRLVLEIATTDIGAGD
jgi:hypothetical protein